MQNPVNSVLLFAILCASSVLGFFVHPRLPERHRSAQSIALVQLAISLLVTFTAIVLGLLTTSVKDGFAPLTTRAANTPASSPRWTAA